LTAVNAFSWCAIAAGVPFAWIVGGSVYGIGDVEMALRRVGKNYVLGVNSSHHVRSRQRKPPVAGTAEEISGAVNPSRWQRFVRGRRHERRAAARRGI
jgi:SRSO17 transposase